MNCKQCNKPLEGKYTLVFCSRSCSASYNNKNKPKRIRTDPRWKACPTCGKQHVNKYYCSHACRPKKTYKEFRAGCNEMNARYRSNKKYQTPADEDRTALKEFYSNCPEGHEVDHIKPISKGGHHSISNLQYLTISENRKKSNK